LDFEIMPIYVYKCSAGHVTEQFRAISQYAEKVVCSECGKRVAKLQPAPTGAPVFKRGSGGFYSPNKD
jgi:putative FmdB family regulatory protein